jgi:hypothetical protein
MRARPSYGSLAAARTDAVYRIALAELRSSAAAALASSTASGNRPT